MFKNLKAKLKRKIRNAVGYAELAEHSRKMEERLNAIEDKLNRLSPESIYCEYEQRHTLLNRIGELESYAQQRAHGSLRHDIGVLISGASGHPNYGDDRIALEVTKFHLASGKNVWINSFNVNTSSDGVNLTSAAVGHINYLWSNLPKERLASFGSAIKEGLRIFDTDFEGSSKLFVDLLAGTKTFHLHGGGYLNSIWPHGAFQIGAAIAMKRKFGTRLIATGLGLMPLNSEDRASLAEAVSHFDAFECRDEDSVKALSAHSASVDSGVDDIFISPQRGLLSDGAADLHLCLQLAQWNIRARAECMAKIDRFLAVYEKDIGNIVVWEFCPQGDLELLEYPIFSKMRERVVVRKYGEIMREGPLARVGDLAIVSRFHAHLLFCRQGVRGLYTAQGGPSFTSEYYDTKHGSLLKIGSNWRSFDLLEEINMSSFGPVPDWKAFNESAERRKKATYASFFQ
ncbi:MAG: polysaccharide pyruvyl transferase family protein [Cystobacterineae bacterium]|nr:polysaccharide pyruvyl transferase family protein [Cystobacterineae bacterium]